MSLEPAVIHHRMVMKRKRLVTCGLIGLLAAAAAFALIRRNSDSFATSLKRITTGMSRETVIQILGAPQHEGEVIPGVFEMYYPYPERMRQHDGLMPFVCVIVLIDGKVVRTSTGYR